MRREDRDELIRSFLAINAMLRQELKETRAELAARGAESKYNPDWRLQPRAPRGTREGGQWVDDGGSGGGGPKNNRRNQDRGAGPGHNRPPPDSLQEVFPGLPGAAASAILAPVDGFLGVTQPGQAARDQASRLLSQNLIAEIRQFDPSYTPPPTAEPGGFPSSTQGINNYINALRADRAAAIYRVTGNAGPLQVEALRYMQTQVDRAFERGQRLLALGRLSPRLSAREALGNYIDREVRDSMRDFFAVRRLDWGSDRQIGIQRREYDTSGTDATYRIPDVRISRVAFDATISRKTPGQGQIRGFFNSDFGPTAVIVVRPTSLGGSYLITRPASRPPRG